MKLVTVKSPTEVGFTPEQMEFTTENGSLKSVSLRTPSGERVVIKADYSPISVLKVQDFEEQTRYAVRGAIAGIEFNELFEDYGPAVQRQRELESAGATAALSEVRVRVREDGTLIT